MVNCLDAHGRGAHKAVSITAFIHEMGVNVGRGNDWKWDRVSEPRFCKCKQISYVLRLTIYLSNLPPTVSMLNKSIKRAIPYRS